MVEGEDKRSADKPPQREAMLPKRFYKRAAAVAHEGGYRIELDGRPVNTPGKLLLVLPTRGLAEAVAGEWDAQGERVDPETMPVLRLANSAFEGVRGREDAVRADIVAFAASDLLCYRAGHPADLVERQAAAWDPVLAWASEAIGARFVLAEGVMPVEQPGASLAAVDEAVREVDAFGLAALHVMTTLTGSALLALAHVRGALSVDEAWAAAHVDEDFQIEQWGHDEEAAARRAYRRGQMDAAARFWALLDDRAN